MKRVVEDGDLGGSSAFEEVTVDPVVRGFVKDWDAMEDLLHHVLYTCLGWEIGEEGQILFTDPLSTPKVNMFNSLGLYSGTCRDICLLCFLDTRNSVASYFLPHAISFE